MSELSTEHLTAEQEQEIGRRLDAITQDIERTAAGMASLRAFIEDQGVSA